MTKKPPSPMIGMGQQASQTANKLGAGQEQAGVQGEQSFLQDPYSSPFTKALMTTGRENLSNAYQNAASGVAQRARAAGFGYQQPATQGAQAGLQSQEAQAAAQIPMQSAIEAAPIVQQGYGDIAKEGLGEQGIGADYFKSTVPLEQQYQGYSLGYTPLWQRTAQSALQGAIAAA